jgi:hypothetical protein
MEPAVVSDGRERVRRFLESGQADERRVTAEWLAGRLGVPVEHCAVALDGLARERVVRRHRRASGAAWFQVVTGVGGGPRLIVALVALIVSCSVVAAGALLEHVFYFAMGLAVGIMITFAWLDWELRTRA